MPDMYFISLLAAAINNTAPKLPPEDIDWNKMYVLADKNGVAGTLYYSIIKLPKECRPNKDVFALFEKSMRIALGIESMQHFEISALMDLLEQYKIEYIPLKGWLMKNYYPYPNMRTMCDVDILINQADMGKIPKMLAECGFELEAHGANHDGYIKSGNIATEIHWGLFSEDSDYYGYFKDILQRAENVDGREYQRYMSLEDFYLHMIAHLAKHFEHSGTGIRSFADIYLYKKAVGDKLDKDYINDGLAKLGLLKFASVAEKAAFCWFSENGKPDDECDMIADYILYLGTYGRKDVGIVSGVGERGGSRGKYLLRRFFPRRSFLIPEFPILEKYPVLLPVCWVVRGIRCVLFKRDRIAYEVKTVKDMDNESLHAIGNIKKLCGLDK